ncbi:MAG TPA: PHP domain-containing protein [Bacteroidales bacterium]|nr:PHP domain-containing protein [Bacteroidales bacterium]
MSKSIFKSRLNKANLRSFKNDKLVRLLIILFILSFLIICAFIDRRLSVQIINPYDGINWKNCQQYKANLHTHTMVSDGWMNPQSVVELYHKWGYRILAITDHAKMTYPWEEFSKFRITEKTRGRIVNKTPKPQETGYISEDDTIFINLNPSDFEMIDVQGAELYYDRHDVNSYFNNYESTDRNGTLDSITARNGIAVFNHPGRYNYPLMWYIDLYTKYDNLIGIEVFNCGNRYPDDDKRWDSILTVMSPARPVWGFSNDDFHSLRDFGRDWEVFLLPEFSNKAVRNAMEKGNFYIVNAPKGHSGPATPGIKSVSVNERKGYIKIEALNCDSIKWISNGEKIGKGSQFSINELADTCYYVRAELYGQGNSVVCTQPFFIKFPK